MKYQLARRKGVNTRSLRSQGCRQGHRAAKKKRADLKVVPMCAWFVKPLDPQTTSWIQNHDKGAELVTRRDRQGHEHQVYRVTDVRMYDLCQARLSPANLRFEAFQEEAPNGVLLPKSCKEVYDCRTN